MSLVSIPVLLVDAMATEIARLHQHAIDNDAPPSPTIHALTQWTREWIQAVLDKKPKQRDFMLLVESVTKHPCPSTAELASGLITRHDEFAPDGDTRVLKRLVNFSRVLSSTPAPAVVPATAVTEEQLARDLAEMHRMINAIRPPSQTTKVDANSTMKRRWKQCPAEDWPTNVALGLLPIPVAKRQRLSGEWISPRGCIEVVDLSKDDIEKTDGGVLPALLFQ
jgi:hypothetical protein